MDSLDNSRRDFLKLMGFSISYAALASGCEAPVRKAIPYLIQPEEIVPGIANFYASTYSSGGNYCSILVKNREGRPIKIEGNELSSITRAGTNARVQASVLGLYDGNRLKNPLINGKETTWSLLDDEVIRHLAEIKNKNGNIRILSSTILSPSTHRLIEEFSVFYPNTKLVTFDPVSLSSIRDAHFSTFGKRVLPTYNFDLAKCIVSFNADFLGTWISPIEFTAQYSKNRKISIKHPEMSKHFQYESSFSLTGSNADVRVPIKPSEEGILLSMLYNRIAEVCGKEKMNFETLKEYDEIIKKTANELLNHKGKSLVISGSNNIEIQTLVIGINYMLNNYGTTVDMDNYSNLKQGSDKEMKGLIEEMLSGKVDALFMLQSNPAYNYFNSSDFMSALKKVAMTISFSAYVDETSKFVNYNCPDSHFLESWNDAEPRLGSFSLAQPAISQLFNTRQAQDSLLKWLSSPFDYLGYIKKHWQDKIFPTQTAIIDFDSFWSKKLHDGVYELTLIPNTQNSELKIDILTTAKKVNNLSTKTKGIEIVLTESVTIGNGDETNNPWLLELSDPITKMCWDNCAMVSSKFASKFSLSNGDIIRISNETVNVEIPVYILNGMKENVIAVNLGFGRKDAGLAGSNVGKNVYPLVTYNGDSFSFSNSGIKIEKTGLTHNFAFSQTHDSAEKRPIVKETNLNEYSKNPFAGNTDREEVKSKLLTLYGEHKYDGHHWAMAIDLNSCTGCANCVVSCQAENNIPVVGKEDVLKFHDMAWMRIDRYFSEENENIKVTHQPMLCQHCDNAPCENVCPVAATMHSSEGLNQMAYNRCVGTRYCANNCPYKVRRFNWHDYTKADSLPGNNTHDPAGLTDDLHRMVLNPDVTVRSQGVMEKCSFCVQRIQEAKLKAKKENRLLKDGEMTTACQQSCPAKAIEFGDLNDKNSKITQLYKDERVFHALEELHTLPSVGYLTKVRNT